MSFHILVNEHHARKNGNKSLCEKMLFCPYHKVKLHNYKINGINLDNIHVEKVFVKAAKSSIIMMKKKTFTNVLSGLYQLQNVMHQNVGSFFMILKVWLQYWVITFLI